MTKKHIRVTSSNKSFFHIYYYIIKKMKKIKGDGVGGNKVKTTQHSNF